MYKRGVAALALLFVLAGCSSSVTGVAEPAAQGGPTGGAPTGGGSDCSGDKKVSPSGAPYCFLVPAGFIDLSEVLNGNRASAGTSAKHRSAVGVSEAAVLDLIQVSDYELNVDTTSFDDTAITKMLDGLAAQLAAGEFVMEPGSKGKLSIDGARAFRYTGAAKDGSYASDMVFAFKGRHEVQLNCQSATHKSDIQRGCAEVQSSLKITQ